MTDLSSAINTEAPVLFPQGTVLFAQGDPSRFLYIVKKGKVVLLKHNSTHLNIVKICGEKDILNELSVLTKQPNEFAAIAKTEVELVLIDQRDILSIINNSPDWVPDIFETLCQRLKSTEAIIQEHNLLAGSEKSADLILTKSDEKIYLDSLAAYKV